MREFDTGKFTRFSRLLPLSEKPTLQWAKAQLAYTDEISRALCAQQKLGCVIRDADGRAGIVQLPQTKAAIADVVSRCLGVEMNSPIVEWGFVRGLVLARARALGRQIDFVPYLSVDDTLDDAVVDDLMNATDKLAAKLRNTVHSYIDAYGAEVQERMALYVGYEAADARRGYAPTLKRHMGINLIVLETFPESLVYPTDEALDEALAAKGVNLFEVSGGPKRILECPYNVAALRQIGIDRVKRTDNAEKAAAKAARTKRAAR